MEWNPDNPKMNDWLRGCAKHLSEGGLALLPTETGYMFAANGLCEEALEALYDAKGRPEGQATHLAVENLEMAKSIVKLREETWKILEVFGKGPLTLIGRVRKNVPARIHGPNRSLGFRLPDHPGTSQILKIAGFPLTATSANRAGLPHERSADAILAQFPSEVVVSLWVLRDDIRTYERPSTMVLEQESGYTVLREGPVNWAELEEKVLRG